MSKRMINQAQLQMFMKPSELRRKITGSVDYVETDDPTADWEGKKEDNRNGLGDSVARHGVQQPVILDHGQHPRGSIQMGNGHHRVQAAKEVEDAGREIYIPVLHTDGDFMGYDARRIAYPGLPS